MKIKVIIGALVKDVPRYLLLLMKGNKRYLELCNRNEQLYLAPNGEGYTCNWQWTSDLYLPKVFPIFGKWLFNRTLSDYPIRLADKPANDYKKPDISFLIGHRGLERLPLLLMTLKSIAGQSGCKVECIVVEQDNESLINNLLPDWVRCVHTPLPEKDMLYSRSWAFNVAAKEARSDYLIFHDNDMLVPQDYASSILKRHREGYEFINLKRFIFYISKLHSEKIVSDEDVSVDVCPEAIVQNLEAGGSFGADKSSYWEIGGFDERFVGWGGEDNEFWERANTRKVYPYGFLPIVHLWHEAQGEKKSNQINGLNLYKELRLLSPAERISSLTSLITKALD